MTSRLQHALSVGAFQWPEGRLVALRPEPLLEGLPLERTQIEHGFFPAAERWRAAGADVVESATPGVDAAYVAVQRARGHSLQLLARALGLVRPGGLVVVDGPKANGVDAFLKAAGKVLPPEGVIAKAHGKLGVFRVPEVLPEEVADWARPPAPVAGWQTARAGFSADGPDPGSELLVQHLPKGCAERALDLGGGWGYLTAGLLKAGAARSVDLVEAEADALAAARENLAGQPVTFFWGDALTFEAGKGYDLIVTNPPFHTGRAADPALGQAFIDSAARLLAPTGTLALVANRKLPYEQNLSARFAEVKSVTEQQGYKVLHARKPRRPASRRT